MPKFLASLLISLLLSIVYLWFPNPAQAVNCTFSFDPNPPDQNNDTLKVKIESLDIPEGTKYFLDMYRKSDPIGGGSTFPFLSQKVPPFSRQGVTVEFTKPVQLSSWPSTIYNLYLMPADLTGLSASQINDPRQIAECTTSFNIGAVPAQNTCTLELEDNSLTPDTDVIIKVNNIQKSEAGALGITGGYDICIDDGSIKDGRTKNGGIYYTNIGDRFNLHKFKPGNYIVSIKGRYSDCRLTVQDQCPALRFKVGQASSNKNAAPLLPAGTTGGTECNYSLGIGNFRSIRGLGIQTAIGCIPTQPDHLVAAIFIFMLGIGGGISFLLMIIATFRMITSAGNPDVLRDAHSMFTNSIVGILFIVFSILFLQIIGVDILGLRGFIP